MRRSTVFGLAFLDGFSFAGLFMPLRRPGAPTQVFAPEGSPSRFFSQEAPVSAAAMVEKADSNSKELAHQKVGHGAAH